MRDAKSISRNAQRLIVEARRGCGSPPQYGAWRPIWGAKVDRVEINRDSTPSVATIWFPELRWHETFDLLWGDMVRIRTEDASPTIIFVGFVVSYLSDFSGGTDRSKSFERNAVVCKDHRWLLSQTSPIIGQVARGPDDYTDYGTDQQTPIADSYTRLSGQRTIFNPNGWPNKDPTPLTISGIYGGAMAQIPIFINPGDGVFWTAKDMLCHVLSRFFNRIYELLPIFDPSKIAGLDHEDWDKVLNHIVIDGLNVVEAIQVITKHLGWGFRENYTSGGYVGFRFYKIAAASGYSRDSQNVTILHRLHAPSVGENIKVAVAAGKKLLWSMSLAEDIADVVNKPWGLGAPHRFEITAELVPAWLDEDLEPDTSGNNANLFFTEAELQDITEPDLYSYYNHYHPRGSGFRRNVGRKWALNETGKYSKTYTYDRGMPFDFSAESVGIPRDFIYNDKNKRMFAPFNRRLLPCLTLDKDGLNSIGILIEISFDGGESWQVIPASISSLENECGIYINEANLAELVDQAEGKIEGEEIVKDEEGNDVDLNNVQLNYWTSLCNDKIHERIFKDKDEEEEEEEKPNPWKTRVRATASIQLDRRLLNLTPSMGASGSPFRHSQVYDFSEKYGLLKRADSSRFKDTELPVHEIDSSEWFDKHLDAVRQANEDMSISGQFTLERLWLGDGYGSPNFAIGDCIEKITGREYDLSTKTSGGGTVYPEIIQIIYLPDKQKMKLITRDLRFAEVLL